MMPSSPAAIAAFRRRLLRHFFLRHALRHYADATRLRRHYAFATLEILAIDAIYTPVCYSAKRDIVLTYAGERHCHTKPFAATPTLITILMPLRHTLDIDTDISQYYYIHKIFSCHIHITPLDC